MFIIDDGKIVNAKTLNIGKTRVINLQFQSDIDFADTDTFRIVLGGTVESTNYAFNNAGYVRFSYVDVDTLITSSSNSITVKVYQGETQILDDTITVTADYAGGGGVSEEYVNNAIATATANLASETYVDTSISTATTGLASETYVNTAIGNTVNTSPIVIDNVDKTTSITVAYQANKHIYQYTYNGSGTLEIALSGITTPNTPTTFEVWINTTTAVSTLTFSSGYTVIGIPDSLEASKTHVFVVRVTDTDTVINYSYAF